MPRLYREAPLNSHLGGLGQRDRARRAARARPRAGGGRTRSSPRSARRRAPTARLDDAAEPAAQGRSPRRDRGRAPGRLAGQIAAGPAGRAAGPARPAGGRRRVLRLPPVRRLGARLRHPAVRPRPGRDHRARPPQAPTRGAAQPIGRRRAGAWVGAPRRAGRAYVRLCSSLRPVARNRRKDTAMATTRTATTQWKGALFDGSGTVSLDSSGVGTFDVSWPSRAEAANGKTSPEALAGTGLRGMRVWPGNRLPARRHLGRRGHQLRAVLRGRRAGRAVPVRRRRRSETRVDADRGGRVRLARLPARRRPGPALRLPGARPVRPRPRAPLQPGQAAARPLRQGRRGRGRAGTRRCSRYQFGRPGDGATPTDSAPYMPQERGGQPVLRLGRRPAAAHARTTRR